METNKKAHKKVAKVMHEFKAGTLTSHGEKVTDHSQAIAIALSEARKIDPNYQMSARKSRRATGGFGDKAKALWGKTKEQVSKAHKAITPHVKSAFEKSKEVAGKGYEKVEAGVKSGYRKSRRYTEQKIHDQKKKIALQVIDDTIDKVSGNTHKNTLAGAEELVEDKYGKGGGVEPKIKFTPKEKNRGITELSIGNKSITVANDNTKIDGEQQAKYLLKHSPIDWIAKWREKNPSGDSMGKGVKKYKNLYKGMTSKQIWDMWNNPHNYNDAFGVRHHFLKDHRDEFDESYDFNDLVYKEYKDLPDDVKRVLDEHRKDGSYEYGGSAMATGGKAGVIAKVGAIPSGVNIRFNRYDEPFVVNYTEGEGVTEWLAKFKKEYPNVEQYPSRQTGGGADEASPSVATLIAFADTNEKLSEEKAQIYTMAEQMKWDTERLHQQFKRIFSYMTETAYNKEHPEAPIEMTEDERNEFADMVSNPMITPIVSSEGEPNISGAKANLEEANRKLDEAENHADTTEDKIEEAKTNVEHAQDDLQGNPLPFKDAGKIKNSSMTKEKEKLAEKISKLEVALAGNKLSAKARASI